MLDDVSGLPTAFLEAYPFPALVIVVPLAQRPHLISRDTDVTVRGYEDVSPLSLPGPSRRVTIAWANEKWLTLVEGQELQDVVDGRTEDSLLRWAENGQNIFQLSLLEPAITLNLARTTVPLYPPSSTHTFCIVTAQTAPAYVAPPEGDYFASRPSDATDISVATMATTTSTTDTSTTRSEKRKGRRRWRPTTAPPLTDVQLASQADECWRLMGTVDWAQTELGPREAWAKEIDPLLWVVFQSKTQDCLWLGKDLRVIYNMNYAAITPGAGHPWSFGRKGYEVWAPIKQYIEPFFEACWRGESIYRENDMLSYERLANGQYVERYHTWRYNPVRSEDGTIIGIYNQSLETTETVIAERRLNSVRDLSEHMLVARTQREFYGSVAQVIEANPQDAPFLLAYSIKEEHGSVEAKLESTVGVPAGHPSAPQQMHLALQPKLRASFPRAERLSSPTLSAISALSSGSGQVYATGDGAAWPIAKALQTRQCVIVEDCRALVRGYPVRSWGVLPDAAVIVPICGESTLDTPEGVLILGLNPCRPFDEEYDSWIHVIRSQLASALVSVKGFEAEAQRRVESERLERAKQAWFRGAAHDLRSPLTLVLGPIEDVLASNLSQNQKAGLLTAKRNVERLMRLVNTLMDFSRLEAGKVEGKFVPTDIGVFVADLAAFFRPAVEKMRIEFVVNIEPSDRLVFIDPTLFETVISNLIGNALKYTEKGRIEVKVAYRDMLEVSVIDTGVGIPAAEVSQVAEWYHRATTAIHSGTQGTGLGLALAQELLKLHDGELLVKSSTAAETGRSGSTFTARIPLTQRDVSSPGDNVFGKYGKAVADEAMRWTKAPSDADSDPSDAYTNASTKLSEALLFEKSDSILLVDDNLDMREYIKHILAPYCRIYEAKDGYDALEMAALFKPRLIISDYMMPKMGGMELLVELRKREDTRITPFIMMSAVTGDETKVDALMNGADDYIAKPFKPKELLARAHLHLQMGKKRVQLEKMYAERAAEIALLSDLCPAGIMRGDMQGNVTYANAAWRAMAGMGPDENPNDWPSYAEPSVHSWLWPLWTEWLGSDRPELETGWKWLSGRTVSARFIRLDLALPGVEAGVLGCLTDTTHELMRIEDAERGRREAEESKHQQELLIDLTSHEIRTPVSAILQCSSLVKENLTSLTDSLRFAASAGVGFKPTPALLHDLGEDIEALESIYQCGLVQERIAGDVLSLARIQLDMLSLHDVEMDVRHEARKVLGVFASEAKMKRIELGLEFGDSMERVLGIKTDPVRLGQVVTNLISNAIRFTASSEVRRITVRYDVSWMPPEESCGVPANIGTERLEDDTPLWLFVAVRDTGPGLGPKELAQLFKRFSQGNKMIHTRYGGSGLGLFICKKITEMLEGRIEVQSELGRGSVFRFYIKTRVAPPLRPSLQGSGSDDSMVRVTASPAPDGAKGLHILIVEDNIINQTVLKRQIIKAGLTCDVANDGLEAVNLVREADRRAKRGGGRLYDCVLMDLEMPVMDGLTAVREIRAAEAAGMSRNMVIALTGNARQGQIDQAMQAGMDDVVIKPYVLSNLLRKIVSHQP